MVSLFWAELTLLDPILSKMESRSPGLCPFAGPTSPPKVEEPPSSICLLNGLLYLRVGNVLLHVQTFDFDGH